MLRVAIFAATVLCVGCPSTKPEGPRVAPDRALRVRVAMAEAKRDVATLVELAKSDDIHARELALRGLGRIGAVKEIGNSYGDRDPRIASAAAGALGLAAALDDLPRVDVGRFEVEPLGRAGDQLAQERLAECARTNGECGIALGRHGRRKIKLTDNARGALIAATSSNDPKVRYGAVYALMREHEPPADDAVAVALEARIGDENPETRALAIAALAKRKAVVVRRKRIEDALTDPDWRVAVEAVRALINVDDAGRAAVAASMSTQAMRMKSDEARAHVILEALRLSIGKSFTLDASSIPTTTPTLTLSWMLCLSIASAPIDAKSIDQISRCPLPDHLRLPLLADIVKSGVGDANLRRAAMRILLAHEDPRVRGAGISALPSTWKDNDAKGQATIIGTIASALAAKNPIVAGSAVDAATALYDAMGKDHPLQAALDSALVARAASETDVELSASLLELVGKRAIVAGADACKAGLSGHPVRAKAAAECLRALGQAAAPPPLTALPLPPVDLETVIGQKLRWHLQTTRGEIVIELHPDVAPWAVAAIVKLTRQHFYDGIEFHRVVPNFVVQGGDPTMSGWGGPGFTLPAEPSSSADGPGFTAGGVGMADAGRDSGGSQWFIMHSRAPHLDGRYTWFGTVVSGQKAADSLQIGDKVDRAAIEQL